MQGTPFLHWVCCYRKSIIFLTYKSIPTISSLLMGEIIIWDVYKIQCASGDFLKSYDYDRQDLFSS